ncbi:hypothetical protein BGX31_008322 [Mortierella sp. GBA43]|nr:hypothetical protein BGX31_008322 [Mortierella sp. GBA43]
MGACSTAENGRVIHSTRGVPGGFIIGSTSDFRFHNFWGGHEKYFRGSNQIDSPGLRDIEHGQYRPKAISRRISIGTNGGERDRDFKDHRGFRLIPSATSISHELNLILRKQDAPFIIHRNL